MIDVTQIKVGTTIITKKNHPCGSNKWKVNRIGIDFKLQCLGCNHEITVDRFQFEKRIKGIINDEL